MEQKQKSPVKGPIGPISDMVFMIILIVMALLPVVLLTGWVLWLAVR